MSAASTKGGLWLVALISAPAFLASCGGDIETATVALHDQHTVGPTATGDLLPPTGSDDDAVWSPLLRARYTGSAEQIVIIDTTEPGEYLLPLPDSIGGIDVRALGQAFAARNRQSTILGRRFDLSVPYQLLAPDAFDAFFAEDVDQGWADFYARFPGSGGAIVLSRPAIAPDRQSAVVFVADYVRGDRGFGRFFVLRRGAAGWEVAGEELVWVV